MSISYRRDIDGLRALAVIPVVLFHAGVPAFSGGFVGVDIFFVISGFLISSIILRDLKSSNYSFAKFYHRRIKRIFPALFSVILLTTLASMWLMFPVSFHKYQQSLFSTLLFYSNYFFMFDVGYFAEHAESKPLLHMWSLAVEEQFYVLFPIYLFMINKYFNKHILKFTVTLFVLSLIYSIILLRYLPSDAFYSTPARAWELLMGSILAIVANRNITIHYKLANYLSLIGFASILCSVFLFTKATHFPAELALFPVIGSALIIFSGTSYKTIIGKLLESKFFVFFGLISYSLYLWHWPTLVLFKVYSLGQETTFEIFILLVIIVFISFLSWKFVENPFRKSQLINKQTKFKISYYGLILLVFLLVIFTLSNIKYKRNISLEIRKLLSARAKQNKPVKLSNCSRFFDKDKNSVNICILNNNNQSEVSFAILGDSHGSMLNAGIQISANKHNNKGIYAGSGGCLPLIGVHQVRQGFHVCERRINAFIQYLIDNPNIKDIILISRWAIYATGTRYKNTLGSEVFIKDKYTKTLSKEENESAFDRSFKRTIEKLSQMNRSIYIVAQVPESEFSASDIALVKILNRNLDTRPSLIDYNQRQRIVSKVFSKYLHQKNYTIIYPHKSMCLDKFCNSIDVNGVSIYRDNSHITRSYAKELAPIFDEIFNKN